MRSPHRLLLSAFAVLALTLAGAPRALAQDGAGSGETPAPAEAAESGAEEAAEQGAADQEEGWQEAVNRQMKEVNTAIGGVFFFPVPIPGTEAPKPTQIPFTTGRGEVTEDNPDGKLLFTQQTIPFAVLWLVLGAIFFTVRMGFVQLRMLGHAIQITRGQYDDPDDEGEVSHFEALSAALSATVGLGNIAGVAIAISVGGPGATFWMILAGFLGMASKFTECSLGQIYRQERGDGSVMGGAMYYLSLGLKERGLRPLGVLLAVTFAILCIGGSLAGGNSFQVNQSLGALGEIVPLFEKNAEGVRPNGWIYGVIMTAGVGIVILGGLRRIAEVASKIVPTMCAVYVLGALFVILSNIAAVPSAFGTIVSGAFTPEAGLGGFLGVLIVGFQRAAFSNEAGVGSAAIAHSAAKSKYAVREGIVALLEPLIDTVIVCTMTALVIVITGAYVKVDPAGAETVFKPYIESNDGAGLTSQAFASAIPGFQYVLGVAVVLFAFSTMISWSYYGERCFAWLFGDGLSLVYKVLFLTFTFLGSVITATEVLNFGDLMILGMAIPNVLGVILLSGKVREKLDEYSAMKQRGEF